MKKSLVIIAILLFSILWYMTQSNNRLSNNTSVSKVSQLSKNSQPVKKKKISLATERIFKDQYQKIYNDLNEFCPEFTSVMGEKQLPIQSEQFAYNLHFKKEDGIYRIRIFLEDGDEGSFEKLVTYKEDRDGFAQILPLSHREERDTSQKHIQELVDDSEIIYESKDLALTFENGREYSLSLVNGKPTRLSGADILCVKQD